MRSTFVKGFCGAVLGLGSFLACAADWPTKPVEMLVPFPPGGGTDAFARPLFAMMSRLSGKQFVIENRGGGGGTVGAAAAAQAPADGYHFFVGAVHHSIAPALYPRLQYDLERDFVPIGLIGSVPQVIVVNPKKVPASDLKALIQYVVTHPGKLNYGSAGNGTSHQMACELFKMQTGSYVVHIPYRGSGPALQDLIAGQVDMMCDGLGSSAPHINSGRIKALAVASDKRAPGFPDLPTAAELGLPDFRVSTWYGIWAPKNTPVEAREAMAELLKRSLSTPEIKKTWFGLGADTPALYGEEFGKFVGEETKRWAPVVKRSGAKLD